LKAALQFKPSIRRPQKPLKSKSAGTAVTAVPVHQGGSNKSFLQDVSRLQEDIANDDVNGFYRTLEGQRLARKAARKKKRKNNDGKGTYIWSWDDDYDPTHPNDYDTYKDSDEQLREQIEWKRYLEGKDELEDEGEEEEDTGYRGFAPPKEYEEREEPEWEEPQDEGEEFVPEPAAEVNVDESADEVFARRMRMAQEAGLKIRPPTPPPVVDLTKENPPAPPPPPPVQPANISPPAQPQVTYDISFTQPPSLYASAPGMPSAPPPPSTHTPSISSEPVHYSSEPVHYESSTNSSEPVRYEETSTTQDEPRGSHPGQKNFASRLMSKYGWEKGQSLGATPTQGLVTPLLMKVDKDRKGAGVIINKNKQVEDHGPFGKMSRCIMMWNVVGRGEVDEDLVEDIGQECREKVLFRFFALLMW
jgi:splicing factor 45